MVSYQKWLNQLFGGSVTQPREPSFQPDAAILVDLIHRTLTCSGTDLTRFSDKQVNCGLNHLFNPSSANIVFALKDATVAAEARSRAVQAIKLVYSGCFERRARPVLGHLDERGGSAINAICYMLWDVTPIGVWGHRAGCEYFDLSLEVLEFALYLPNPACVESALHGLGHLSSGQNQRVHRIIDTWVKQAQSSRPELITYALAARRGTIL